jgi:hypothetical protein
MMQQTKNIKIIYKPKSKKMKTIISLMLLIAISFASCKKDNGSSTPAGSYADFLKNSEWVGTLDKSGYQFAPPCCLKFKTAGTITVYAPFNLLVNGAIEHIDSINGTVNSIDTLLADGRTKIKATFQYFNDVELFITNRKTLTSVSTDPNKLFPLQLEIFPAAGFSVNGKNWSGPVMTGNTATGFAYPDLSTIYFLPNGNAATYSKNGRPVLATPTPQIPTPGILEVAFQQKGARVYMFGFNENGLLLIPYFGVLLPSGNSMMVSSRSRNARLPHYTQTIAWYGGIGVTPIINKY